MRVTRDITHKDGSRSLTVRLKPGNGFIVTETGLIVSLTNGVKVVPVHPSHHYRLGGQVEDIVAPHVITEAEPVYWCSIEQKWMAA